MRSEDGPISSELSYRLGVDQWREYEDCYGPFGGLSFEVAACVIAGIAQRFSQDADSLHFDPVRCQAELHKITRRLRTAGRFSIAVYEPQAEEPQQTFYYQREQTMG
jgi:hypothetical protein